MVRRSKNDTLCCHHNSFLCWVFSDLAGLHSGWLVGRWPFFPPACVFLRFSEGVCGGGGCISGILFLPLLASGGFV